MVWTLFKCRIFVLSCTLRLKYIGCAKFSWAQARQHIFGRRSTTAGKRIVVNAFKMTNFMRTQVRKKCEALSGAGLRAVRVTISGHAAFPSGDKTGSGQDNDLLVSLWGAGAHMSGLKCEGGGHSDILGRSREIERVFFFFFFFFGKRFLSSIEIQDL